MTFDLKKYDKCRFHKDELSHKRVKVIILKVEYEAIINNLSIEDQVMLLDYWIEIFIQEQYYELIPKLKQKRFDIINGTNTILYDNLSTYGKWVLFLTNILNKIRVMLKLKKV